MTKTPVNIPDWFRNLPDNAYINAAELRSILGYSSVTSTQVLRNRIPVDRVCVKSQHRNLLWQVSTIRKFLKSCK